MRVFSSHSWLHFALSYSPCTIYTVQTEVGQHEGAHFTQQATFLSLALTVYYIHSADNTNWVGMQTNSKHQFRTPFLQPLP